MPLVYLSRGYLIKEVINVTNGPSEQRTLMTGGLLVVIREAE